MPPLLEVRGLHTEFRTGAGLVRAVDGVSYTVEHGETVAIVGESGSGKSVGALSIMRLIPNPPGRITAGEILFDGRDLRGLSEAQMREVRGRDIGMVFQEPMTSLNPVLTNRPPDHRGRWSSTRAPIAGRPSGARSSSWRRSASPIRGDASSSIPISSPAACASG